jgi:hypothetical protein
VVVVEEDLVRITEEEAVGVVMMVGEGEADTQALLDKPNKVKGIRILHTPLLRRKDKTTTSKIIAPCPSSLCSRPRHLPGATLPPVEEG